MKVQKAVLKETGHIAIGVLIADVIMCIVFALLKKFDYTVVLGALLNGRGLADACALAGEFVKDCIAYTAAQHTDPMHGVQFEKLLPRLFSCHENRTEV